MPVVPPHARRQGAYERAFAELFDSFAWLEGLLESRRYLLGERVTEAGPVSTP